MAQWCCRFLDSGRGCRYGCYKGSDGVRVYACGRQPEPCRYVSRKGGCRLGCTENLKVCHDFAEYGICRRDWCYKAHVKPEDSWSQSDERTSAGQSQSNERTSAGRSQSDEKTSAELIKAAYGTKWKEFHENGMLQDEMQDMIDLVRGKQGHWRLYKVSQTPEEKKIEALLIMGFGEADRDFTREELLARQKQLRSKVHPDKTKIKTDELFATIDAACELLKEE